MVWRAPQDCGQSWRNYPHLANLLIGADIFRDVSCGSATIDDFTKPQDGLPLGNTNPPQFNALGPNVDVVTVGIGGRGTPRCSSSAIRRRFLAHPNDLSYVHSAPVVAKAIRAKLKLSR